MRTQALHLGLIVALLFASTVSANFACLGTPPITSFLQKGDSCGGVIPCASGLYCDQTATCQPSINVGDPCIEDADCPFQSSCNGAPGSKTCYTNANPGEACGPKTSANAVCGTGMACVANKCLGNLGDGCSSNTDCLYATCVNGACGSPCGSSGCSFSQTCVAGSCVSKPTSGPCSSNSDCAPTYICMNDSIQKTNKTCVQSFAANPGDWCDDDQACTSNLCFRQKCMSKSPLACGSCIYGEVCSCDNGYLIEGTGVCKADKCADPLLKFGLCLSNCPSSTFDYTNSCAWKNCADQWNAYLNCDPNQALYRTV